MTYAKLENGRIQYAPNPIRVENDMIGNPTDDVYVAQGYKPVEYTEPPQVPVGYGTVMSWEETETGIVQTWTLVELPPEELSAEEALDIILGGDSE